MPEHPFTTESWKSRVAAWWREAARDLPGAMARLGVRTGYGLLTASAFIPLLEAYSPQNPGPAIAALSVLTAGVGSNLVANVVQGAYDKAAARKSEQEVAERPDLRAEYTQLLGKLGVLEAAQAALGEQWAEFEARLRADLIAQSIIWRIDTAGGTVVYGDVHVQDGDFVGRDKIVHHHTTVVQDDAARQAQQTRAAQCRAAYLRHLTERAALLPLRGVDVGAGDPQRARRPRLAQVYVDLDITASRFTVRPGEARKPDTGEVRLLGGDEGRPPGALETAVRNPRLVLLGDPGSGKSTFANHLAFCLAMHQQTPGDDWLAQLPGWPEAEGDALPVVVILRDFARWIAGQPGARGNAAALGQFLENWLIGHELADFAQPLRDALRHGKAVVFFDGLDEIPGVEGRALVRDAVADFACTYRDARVVVTCRTLSYQDAAWQLPRDRFPAFELAPFDDDKIERFIGAWYAELATLGAVRAEDVDVLAGKLREAVRRPDIQRLAPNPLLLTVMALVHAYRGRLPEARALLYEECTDLLLWRWEEVKATGAATGLRDLLAEARLQDVDLKRALWALAFAAHQGGTLDSTADITETDLLRALRDLHPQRSWDWAAAVVAQVKERAGLLVEREPGVYAFPHRTFQEYLAGCHLSVQVDFHEQAARLADEAAFWREVVLLAVGRQVHVSGDLSRALLLVMELCPVSNARSPRISYAPSPRLDIFDAHSPRPDIFDAHSPRPGGVSGGNAPEDGGLELQRRWRRAWLAGDVLREAGVDRVQKSGASGRELLERVCQRLADLVDGGHLAARERADVGDLLGQLGDPRPGVGIVETQNFASLQPDIVWVKIPAGPCLLGSAKGDKLAHSDEQPQHQVTIPYDTWLARYPTTVAQFAPFVTAGGYEDTRWWTPTGWAWRQGEWDSQVKEDWLRDYLKQRPAALRGAPMNWAAQQNYPNRPVVNVSWFEALAYCRWLEKRLQVESSKLRVWRNSSVEKLDLQPATFNLQLPSEAEWEKAARAGDERAYPWGDEDWDEERANIDNSQIGHATTVGMYPRGATPAGLLDMAGNVWEWTRSLYRPYPYRPEDGREDPDAEGNRVARGGSWLYVRRDARCACRDWGVSDFFGISVGFRVLLFLVDSDF